MQQLLTGSDAERSDLEGYGGKEKNKKPVIWHSAGCMYKPAAHPALPWLRI